MTDIIRKEQDAKNEIETLTSYIRGQDIAEQKNQNPQIVEQMRTRLRELEQIRKSYAAEVEGIRAQAEFSVQQEIKKAREEAFQEE